MNSLLDNPVRALIVGLVVAGLALTVWLVTGPVDPRPLISVLLRFVLVISAMTWIGFVFPGGGRGLQQRYLEVDCPACRGWLSLRVAPNRALRRFATWVFSSQVSLAPPRSFMLAAGALGGLLMWTFVNHAIWPSLKIVLGQTAGDAGAQARARRTVKRYARLNLVLALPVTFAMVAAAHLS
ncbi:MAG: hypothetical protein WA441_10520 [Methyloceanibacter sp.]